MEGMVTAYLRFGPEHQQDVDFIVVTLEPENVLSELRALWRALDVRYVSAAFIVEARRGARAECRWHYTR